MSFCGVFPDSKINSQSTYMRSSSRALELASKHERIQPLVRHTSGKTGYQYLHTAHCLLYSILIHILQYPKTPLEPDMVFPALPSAQNYIDDHIMSFCCVPKPKSRLSTVHARSRLFFLRYIENLRLLLPCLSVYALFSFFPIKYLQVESKYLTRK
jgi:hypothetical protein